MASHTLHDCYNAILRASKTTKALDYAYGYAYGYAREGLRMPDAAKHTELTGESRVQAIYVRANLAGWRGDEAKAVRQALDKMIGK